MSEPLLSSDRLRHAFLRVDRSAVVGLSVLAAVAVVVAALFAWNSRSRPVVYAGDASRPAVVPSVPVPGSAEGSTSASVEPGRSVVVDVVGKVRRPGLVTVPVGSRVADVVQAAGGFRHPRDARSVNQARVVVDGEQVVVGGGPGAGPAPGVGSGSPGGPGATPVDLNTATAEQLETLPGVGPVLAQRILEYRTTNGGFRSVEELNDVSGIGDKTFADLAALVRV